MNERLAVRNSNLEAGKPPISVVIPTRGRPLLVERAVRSALRQSFRDLEVIVIIDGPDQRTEEVLGLVKDQRLHVLSLPNNVGGSEARNIGVRYAKGEWIALLDDDDEWLPEKLARQWIAGQSAAGPYVIVASKFIERTECAERVLPRRTPTSGERFCDYLFVRRGWNSGETFLQTSTLFVSRQLLVDVPFTTGLRRCQDLDWLLHATAHAETRVLIVPEVLAIFHHDEQRARVSRTADWKFLYLWASANQRYFSPRAFSFFIATFCAPSAATQREGPGTFLFLLRKCVTSGTFSLKSLALLLVCWFVPEGRRRGLRGAAEVFQSALSLKRTATAQPLPEKAS